MPWPHWRSIWKRQKKRRWKKSPDSAPPHPNTLSKKTIPRFSRKESFFLDLISTKRTSLRFCHYRYDVTVLSLILFFLFELPCCLPAWTGSGGVQEDESNTLCSRGRCNELQSPSKYYGHLPHTLKTIENKHKQKLFCFPKAIMIHVLYQSLLHCKVSAVLSRCDLDSWKKQRFQDNKSSIPSGQQLPNWQTSLCLKATLNYLQFGKYSLCRRRIWKKLQFMFVLKKRSCENFSWNVLCKYQNIHI